MLLWGILEKVIMLLLTVGFFTLLERKILGFLQLRKGPNKVSVMGLLQPIADALKLLAKEKLVTGQLLSVGPFFTIPFVTLVLTFTAWLLVPLSAQFGWQAQHTTILVVCVMSVGVYATLGGGWLSFSKYALIGGMRAVAQTISYEVGLLFILIVVLLQKLSLEVSSVLGAHQPGTISVFLVFLLGLWGVVVVAETNRAPLDFAEGESELVSGFNVEYGSFEFAFLFMAEYLFILFLSFFTCVYFLGLSPPVLPLMGVFLSSVVLLVRGAYPRLRYDQLMSLAWKSLLNCVLLVLCVMAPLF